MVSEVGRRPDEAEDKPVMENHVWFWEVGHWSEGSGVPGEGEARRVQLHNPRAPLHCTQ
jgi:hypothetical protein